MRRIGDDKRGQEMTLGTIIAIVLGIAVLVFLIFGFSSGWNNLWEKVTRHTSVANVEDRKIDCKSDCSSGEKTAWCSEKKELRFFDGDGKIVEVKGTCKDFANVDFEVTGKVGKGKIAEMGFSQCPSISCQ